VKSKILIVDDMARAHEYLIEYLISSYNADVDSCQTIGGAIEKIMKQDYNLIILDNLLPVGAIVNEEMKSLIPDSSQGGLAFITALKDYKFRELLNIDDIKIIFYTSTPFRKKEIDKFEKNIIYIQKKSDSGLLLRSIEEELNNTA